MEDCAVNPLLTGYRIKHVNANRLAAMLASFALTFVPVYALERLANYFYLIDVPSTFFFVSGLRLPLFIAFTFSGSIFSGLLLRNARLAIATQLAAVVALLSAFYVLCVSPRVCYSSGPDGLEALRLGFILGSLCVLGASMGVAARAGPTGSRYVAALVPAGSFISLTYFPVVYTFAGARFFPLFYPWPLLLLLGALAFTTSVALAGTFGVRLGALTPPVLMLVIISLSAPMAAAYLAEVSWPALQLLIVVILGSLASIAAPRMTDAHLTTLVPKVIPITVFLVLVLGSFWVIPAEVNGLVPQAGDQELLHAAIGVPVYVGGFMDTRTTPALGIAATVDFGDTNASSIQSDNFLSAGIGAHSPDCCIDGIDYGYRFDVYLFHNGNETLIASAWQVCDDNTACGGHSWKVLMFSKVGPPLGATSSHPVYLQIEWEGHMAVWSYAVGLSPVVDFANFTAPAKENPAFNVGLVDLSSPLSSQQYALFFQFGIMSRYPIGHGGWTVTFSCPGTLQNHVWGCVQQARVAEGGFSFWKVLWRWGEDYPNVTVEGDGRTYYTFSYSPNSTVQNLTPLLS